MRQFCTYRTSCADTQLNRNIPTHQSVHLPKNESGEVVKADVIMLTVLIGNLLNEASGLAAGIISLLSGPLDRFRKKIKEKGGKSCLYSNHAWLSLANRSRTVFFKYYLSLITGLYFLPTSLVLLASWYEFSDVFPCNLGYILQQFNCHEFVQ